MTITSVASDRSVVRSAARAPDALAARFEAARPALRAVAYRMLGSASEADDTVQEARMRLTRADAGGSVDPGDDLDGWLTTVVARLCLDALRTRAARREEPLEGAPGKPDRPDPARATTLRAFTEARTGGQERYAMTHTAAAGASHTRPLAALHFYEARGLIAAARDAGNRRRYPRAVLRRVAVIKAAQRTGVPLAAIKDALAAVPADRPVTAHDWRRLSAAWRAALDRRIAALTALRDQLDACIGCGCLSLAACPLRNPGDALAAEGPGARLLLGADDLAGGSP